MDRTGPLSLDDRRDEKLERFRELGESEPLTLARMLHRRADGLYRDADKLRKLARELVRVSEEEETHGDTSDGARNGRAEN